MTPMTESVSGGLRGLTLGTTQRVLAVGPLLLWEVARLRTVGGPAAHSCLQSGRDA